MTVGHVRAGNFIIFGQHTERIHIAGDVLQDQRFDLAGAVQLIVRHIAAVNLYTCQTTGRDIRRMSIRIIHDPHTGGQRHAAQLGGRAVDRSREVFGRIVQTAQFGNAAFEGHLHQIPLFVIAALVRLILIRNTIYAQNLHVGRRIRLTLRIGIAVNTGGKHNAVSIGAGTGRINYRSHRIVAAQQQRDRIADLERARGGHGIGCCRAFKGVAHSRYHNRGRIAPVRLSALIQASDLIMIGPNCFGLFQIIYHIVLSNSRKGAFPIVSVHHRGCKAQLRRPAAFAHHNGPLQLCINHAQIVDLARTVYTVTQCSGIDFSILCGGIQRIVNQLGTVSAGQNLPLFGVQPCVQLQILIHGQLGIRIGASGKILIGITQHFQADIHRLFQIDRAVRPECPIQITVDPACIHRGFDIPRRPMRVFYIRKG